LVKKLLADGNTVVSTVRGPSTALSTLAESTGARLIILECDIACAESVKKFGEELGKRVSQVDVLINNAGKVPPLSENYSFANIKDSILVRRHEQDLTSIRNM
jgi:NADP-dependent 3-hydroxy acid dehydrogenase YdfG